MSLLILFYTAVGLGEFLLMIDYYLQVEAG